MWGTAAYGAGPAVGDGRVYLSLSRRRRRTSDRSRGAATTRRVTPSPPAARRIRAVSTDGEPAWSYDLGEDGGALTAPVHAGGAVFVGEESDLLALRG